MKIVIQTYWPQVLFGFIEFAFGSVWPESYKDWSWTAVRSPRSHSMTDVDVVVDNMYVENLPKLDDLVRQIFFWRLRNAVDFEIISYFMAKILGHSRMTKIPFTTLTNRSHESLRINNRDDQLYNSPSYSRFLIGSSLWSIRGQTHIDVII